MPSKIVEKAQRLVTEGKVLWMSFTQCVVQGDHSFYTITANLDDFAEGWTCDCEFHKHNDDPMNKCSHVWAAFLISHVRDNWREGYINLKNQEHSLM